MTCSAIRAAAVGFVLLAGCASSAPPHGDDYHPPHEHGEIVVPEPVTLECAGAFVQGGIALCRTLPRADVRLGGEALGYADSEGWFVIGFDRASAQPLRVEAHRSGVSSYRDLDIAARRDDAPSGEGPMEAPSSGGDILSELEREADALRSAAGVSVEALFGGFGAPMEVPADGDRRHPRRDPSRPHFDAAIEAPVGAPIRAPAAGVVRLAEAGAPGQGGRLLIDHGHGLVTAYLHLGRIDVDAGDELAPGQSVGAVGASGAAFDPHLCWRLRWRGRELDPRAAREGLARARAAFVADP